MELEMLDWIVGRVLFWGPWTLGASLIWYSAKRAVTPSGRAGLWSIWHALQIIAHDHRKRKEPILDLNSIANVLVDIMTLTTKSRDFIYGAYMIFPETGDGQRTDDILRDVVTPSIRYGTDLPGWRPGCIFVFETADGVHVSQGIIPKNEIDHRFLLERGSAAETKFKEVLVTIRDQNPNAPDPPRR